MTSTLAGPSSRRLDEGTADGPRRDEVRVLDLLAGGALLVLALVAEASLALAHVGAHSLPAVLALTAAAIGLVVVLCARRVRPRADLSGLAVAVGCAAVAAALTVPGFSYGVADKDPGGYVSHAMTISATGDYSFVDPLLATAAQDPTFPVQLTSPGARFAGVWVRDSSTGLIVPQFYHLWPALLATVHDAGGRPALLAAVPVPGVLSVLLLCAVLRRVGDALLGSAGGLVAAGAGGLLLATNMLQVWQTRYPTTEVLAQALYLGALLGLVVAVQTGWRPAAGAAGLFVGIGWLNRADGLLLVLLSVGLGAALVATRRWDARAVWFSAGLAVVLPHALLQAYDLAASYTAANGVPSLRAVGVLVVGCFAAAVALQVVLSAGLSTVQAALERRRPQVVVGLGVVAAAAGLMALGYLRPRLFGPDYFDYNGRSVRSYDEAVMARLTWFVSLPGFALVLAGLAVVALRRWRAAAWVVVAPTLVLFPLYGYRAQNSTRLLWWTRRYVPTVLPGLIVLIALALALFAVWRFRGRLLTAVPAGLAFAGLTGLFLSQSLPLRAHDEWRGSFALTREIADLAGEDDGVFLWEADQGCCAGPTRLLAIPVWLQHGQLSGLLPSDAALQEDAFARGRMLERYAERFPDSPLFVVADGGSLPVGIDPRRVVPVLDRRTTLPMWEESDVERPDSAREIPVHVSVWRVR